MPDTPMPRAFAGHHPYQPVFDAIHADFPYLSADADAWRAGRRHEASRFYQTSTTLFAKVLASEIRACVGEEIAETGAHEAAMSLLAQRAFPGDGVTVSAPGGATVRVRVPQLLGVRCVERGGRRDTYVLIFERVHGLRDIRRGTPEWTAADAALAELHRRAGVIQYDVGARDAAAPMNNVYWRPAAGEVVLLDFGCAVQTGREWPGGVSHATISAAIPLEAPAVAELRHWQARHNEHSDFSDCPVAVVDELHRLTRTIHCVNPTVTAEAFAL